MLVKLRGIFYIFAKSFPCKGCEPVAVKKRMKKKTVYESKQNFVY